MSRNSPVLFTAALLVIVYAGMAIALPAGAFFSADEGVRFLQIDSFWSWRWIGAAPAALRGSLDPDGEYAPPGMDRADGSFASRYPMMFPFLAGIPGILFSVRGTLILPALAVILSMMLTARLATFFLPGALTGIAGAAAVVTTPLVVHGAMLRDETLAALLLTAGLIPICKAAAADPAGRPRRAHGLAIAGGVLIGLAGATSHAAFLVTPAVVLAGLIVWGITRFGARALAILAGSAAIAVPRALCHGFWLPVPPADQPRFPGALAARLLPQMARPWFAGACVLLLAAWLMRSRLPARMPPAVLPALAVLLVLSLLAAGPIATIVATITNAPLSAKERGLGSLMNVMPLLALAPLVLIAPRGPAFPHLRFLSLIVLFFVVTASALFPAPGGLTWGPAILTPVAGLLAVVLIAMMAARATQPGGRLVTVFLWGALAIGVAVQGTGLRFVASVRSYNAAILERVRSSVADGGVILTDLPDVPLLLASLSPETPCLVVRQGADLESLAARIEEASRTSFWIVRAKSKTGFPGGAQIDLGAGLALLRHEAEAGVRGFMQQPAGD